MSSSQALTYKSWLYYLYVFMAIILEAPLTSARLPKRRLNEGSEPQAITPFVGVVVAGAIGIVCVGFIVWYQRRGSH